MKKVLFLIPTLGGGGAERVLVTLLNNLDKEKYDITLFSLFDGGINKKYLNQDIKYKYFFKKLFRGNIHLLKLFSPKQLYKIIIKDEYDIAVSYLEGITTRILSGCPYNKTKLLNWVHIEIHNPYVLRQSYRSMNEVYYSYKKFNATIFV
ncbi:MAG: glycosyltransferase, partial [Psychrobacillus psychrodurans]